jgi:hypothetical protein
MSVGEPSGAGLDPAPAEIIREDARCLSCGYELRGLTPQGLCPECGTPASLSLRPPGVADADPAWLALQARGARIMMVCSMWVWVLPLVWALALMSWQREIRHAVVFLAVGLGLGLLMVAGVARCCTPEPPRRPGRSLARAAALGLAWGVPAAAALLIAATLAGATVLTPAHWTGWILAAAAHLGFMGSALATMRVQRGEMARLGAPEAASTTGAMLAALFLGLTLLPWVWLAVADGAGFRMSRGRNSLLTCASACAFPPVALLLVAAWLDFQGRCLRAIRLGQRGAAEARTSRTPV